MLEALKDFSSPGDYNWIRRYQNWLVTTKHQFAGFPLLDWLWQVWVNIWTGGKLQYNRHLADLEDNWKALRAGPRTRT
jgi:hypothetical protein